jgi:hypothetical protein
MTREEFQNSEELRAQLDAILKFPIMEHVFEVVRKMGLKPAPQPIPGVDYGAQMASHGAQLLAWNECLEAFKLLTREGTVFLMRAALPTRHYIPTPPRPGWPAPTLHTKEELEAITPE